MPSLLNTGIQGFRAYAELTAPDVDYDILQLQAEHRELAADSLELQVEQEANRLREQFAENVGSAQYGAARRGVKIGEGDIQQNIEDSAMDVGKDIQTAKGNVEFKKKQLKSEADRLKLGADWVRNMEPSRKIGRTASILGDEAQYMKDYYKKKKKGKE